MADERLGALPMPRYPFVGIPSFLRAPVVEDLALGRADIAVLGVPTDEGSPFLPGSRFAPRSIREHSLRFGTGYLDHRDNRVMLVFELENDRVVDTGDVDVLPTNIEETFANITASVRRILDAKAMPVILGGDHAISYPVVRAFNQPLHVVHFDAHVDYAPFWHGYEFTNGHAFRHIRAMPHLLSLTQVGVRSIRNPPSWVKDSIADGNAVVSIYDFRATPVAELFSHLPAGADCYVSIDIDVLDMPLVPGCVSAEPDGMTHAELRDCVDALAEHMNIIGIDLVEVNPLLDIGTGATSYLAAHVILECLGRIFDQPRWVRARDTRTAGPAAAATG